MFATLRGLARGLLDAALPQTCIACGTWIPAESGVACPACRAELLLDLDRPACRRCGRTLPPEAIHPGGCARCRTEHFWNVSGVARAGLYGKRMRSLLVDLKHRGDERNGVFAAELLVAAVRRQAWAAEIECLAPVPMHWLRRLQRPCDHARILAEHVGRRLGLPLVRLVRRVRHTPSQTGLPSKHARFANVRGCFAPAGGLRGLATWPARGTRVRGRTVCIVDNLMLSGATVCEVAKVLRAAGARRVYAAVVARPAAPGDAPTSAGGAIGVDADAEAGPAAPSA